MTVKKYDVQKSYEQVRVTKDENIHILEAVVHELSNKYDGVVWATAENGTLVFEWPMGSTLVGGEDFFEED